ncbi:MAG: DUF3617 domain-containing protein [Acidobacteriaceae bacterium]
MQKQIVFSVAMLGFLGAALAQTSEPPVKMGLWQTTVTSSMSGIQLPPEVAARLQAMGRPLPMGQSHTMITQSCVTREKWKDMFSNMQRNRDCQFTNQHQTSSSLSADMVCKSPDGKSGSNGHIEVNFPSSTKMHGKAHVATTVQSQPQPMVSDVSFDSVYQGADCKGISPDSPKIVQ